MPEELDLEAWMGRNRKKRAFRVIEQRLEKSRRRGFSATRISLDELQMLLDEVKS